VTEGHELTLTNELINEALKHESLYRGYCICIHPMSTMINITGLGCKWCGQTVREDYLSEEMKSIRARAIITAYPWAGRNYEEGQEKT
jgi:hypothetical protein